MSPEAKDIVSFLMEKGLGWAFFAFIVFVVIKALPVLRDEYKAARESRAV